MSREYKYLWPAIIGIGLVFIISNFVWLVPFMRDVEESAARYQKEVARRVVTEADFFIEKKLRAVETLAASISEVNADAKKSEALIKIFLAVHAEFTEVVLRPAEMARGEYVVSGVQKINGEKTMTITVPLVYTSFDMVARVKVRELALRAARERVGNKGGVYIMDAEGGIIFHPREVLVSVGMLRARQFRGVGDTVVYENEGGDAVSAAAVASAATGWLVVVESPLYEAWANKYYAINLAIVLMLVGTLFVIIISINVKRIMGIARREQQLAEGKSSYISLLAHQLRTPLAGTKWNLKTLLDGDWGPVNHAQKKFLMRSYETNEQMIALVRDLLDITRIEEGRYGFMFKKTDIGEWVTRTVNEFRGVAREAGIALIVKKPRGTKRMPKIMIDEEKMQMALGNLIDNAIRYNQPEGRVEVKYHVENKICRVQVKDTGVGIPRRDQHKLFTKFFRGDNVVKMQVQGFGLGLYIVKNIVERHGGTIAVQSKENQGTVFTITLPIG